MSECFNFLGRRVSDLRLGLNAKWGGDGGFLLVFLTKGILLNGLTRLWFGGCLGRWEILRLLWLEDAATRRKLLLLLLWLLLLSMLLFPWNCNIINTCFNELTLNLTSRKHYLKEQRVKKPHCENSLSEGCIKLMGNEK